MPRPRKMRRIGWIPTVCRFVPCSTPSGENSDSCSILHLEELEAIRLKDVEGFDQNECAILMEISRPTFQRILLSARKKIADALINGYEIVIQDRQGNFPTGCGMNHGNRGGRKRGHRGCGLSGMNRE